MSDTPHISTMVYKALEVLERLADKGEHHHARESAERVIDEGLGLLGGGRHDKKAPNERQTDDD